MASTTTAPSRWTITGLQLDQARSGSSWQRRRRSARRSRRLGSAPRRRSARSIRLGAAGSGMTRDPVERLGVDAAEADHEHRHDARRAATAMRSSTPGAAIRSTSTSRAAPSRGSDPLSARLADARFRRARSRARRAVARSCGACRAPRRLTRHRAAEVVPGGDGVVLVGGEPAVGDRDAARAQQRLGLVLGEPRPVAAPRRCGRRSRAGARRRQRRGQRGGDARCRCAGRRPRHARLAELPRRLVVEQLGQRRRDHHRHGRDRRAREDRPPRPPPSSPRRAGDARRAVVEHEHVPDRGVSPTRRIEVAQRLDLAPDHRRVVERVGDRGGGGQHARGERAIVSRRERRQREAHAGGLVGPEAESPPEQVRIAVPPPRGRGAADRQTPSRARAGRGRRRPTPRPPPRPARGTRDGHPPPRPCGRPPPRRPPPTRRPSAPPRPRPRPRTRRAPRTAARRRRRPRSAARSTARLLARASTSTQSGVVTTASFPHEIAVCSRSPRRVASAFTTRLPLCETSATCPGCGEASASPHSAARDCSEISPSQFGPQTGIEWRRAASRSSSSNAARPPSRRTRRRRRPRRRSPAHRPRSITSGTPAAGIATTTASGTPGRSVERREAGQAVDRRPARVDAPHVAVKPRRAGSGGSRTRRCRAARTRRRPPPIAGGAARSRSSTQCSVRSTPRRSRARATIRRWISLVPSQMRSTRSSRRKRSATLVRM